MSLSSDLRALRGKRLVRVTLRPFDDGLGQRTYDPVFEFEGGATVRFVVHETDYGCEYGVDPVVEKKQ
jgi:hypothetical protein